MPDSLLLSPSIFLRLANLKACRILFGLTEVEGVDLRQRNIPNFDVLVAPFVEEFDAANLVGNIFGKDRIGGRGDLNFSAVGHDGQFWFCSQILVSNIRGTETKRLEEGLGYTLGELVVNGSESSDCRDE